MSVSYTDRNGNPQIREITHTADLYYEVGVPADGLIKISLENSTDVLSVTKLKVTNETGPVVLADVILPVTAPEAVKSAHAFRMAAAATPEEPAESEPVTETEEPTEAEPVTEAEEPTESEPVTETEEPTESEPITETVEPAEPENPAGPDQPKPVNRWILNLLDLLFGSIRSWFRH